MKVFPEDECSKRVIRYSLRTKSALAKQKKSICVINNARRFYFADVQIWNILGVAVNASESIERKRLASA